ncbi:MAG TPA: hypothetical protein VGM51_02320 [Armatimonadota bacterium]|jgi:5-methylcytosine-specific restriction endonuclease McrA
MPFPLQKALFCPCGAPAPPRTPLCPRCRQQLANSRRRFGGLRLAVLNRDRHHCAACDSVPIRPHVHHRCPGCQESAQLITLCPRCHVRIHKLARLPRVWLSPLLAHLWQKQHPGAPLQLQLALAALESLA